MNRYPAIALIEFGSVVAGTTAADAMVKTAPIEMVHAGTIHRGKYLVLVGGSVAAVDRSFEEGLRIGTENVLDKVFLPDVHAEVHDAVFGERRNDAYDALGIIESEVVAPVVQAADAGVKGARAHVKDIRLGDGLGGKGIVWFTGAIADVQAAVEIGCRAVGDRTTRLCTTVIPALHEDMIQQVGESTRFHRPARSG